MCTSTIACVSPNDYGQTMITHPSPPPPTQPPGGSWKDAVHPSCDSPNTSRRFALGASNVCLVDKKPTCSVPTWKGCEGLRSYDYGHAQTEYPPPPPSPPPMHIPPSIVLCSVFLRTDLRRRASSGENSSSHRRVARD